MVKKKDRKDSKISTQKRQIKKTALERDIKDVRRHAGYGFMANGDNKQI